MSNLSNISAIGFDKSNPIVSIRVDVKTLIEKFDAKLKERVLSCNVELPYTSIDDILIKKYHLSDIANSDFPDYRNKTEFISDGVRGNLQKIAGNVLSYADGETIIDEAINEELP